MSLSAAVLDALLGAGATREQLAAAMKADIAEREAAEAARLEAQKDGNRERQRRKRERDTDVSRNVTDVTRDARDSVTLVSPQSPPLKVSPGPLQITPPLTPHPPENKRGRSHRLPDEWQPSQLGGKAAEMVRRWQPGELERELAKFRNYWLAKGANATSTNWQRNWVNWLIKADETKANRHERSNNPTADAVNRILGNC